MLNSCKQIKWMRENTSFAMNAGELKTVLLSDIYLSSNVGGIHAVDSLPATQLKPGQGIIANCDTLKSQGTHLV